MPKRFYSAPHLAAAASRFLALAAPGSTDRDLAASSSLLEAMEMFFRLPMTWIWSSLHCKGQAQSQLKCNADTLHLNILFI